MFYVSSLHLLWVIMIGFPRYCPVFFCLLLFPFYTIGVTVDHILYLCGNVWHCGHLDRWRCILLGFLLFILFRNILYCLFLFLIWGLAPFVARCDYLDAGGMVSSSVHEMTLPLRDLAFPSHVGGTIHAADVRRHDAVWRHRLHVIGRGGCGATLVMWLGTLLHARTAIGYLDWLAVTCSVKTWGGPF